MSLDDEITRLSRVPLFSKMNHEALRLLAFAAESRSFAAGENIFAEGEEADGGFLIVEGTVTLSAAGREPVRSVGAGTLLGEQAMLAATRRPMTARAEGPVSAIKISRGLLARVLQEYPANAVPIRRLWAGKLHDRMNRVRD